MRLKLTRTCKPAYSDIKQNGKHLDNCVSTRERVAAGGGHHACSYLFWLLFSGELPPQKCSCSPLPCRGGASRCNPHVRSLHHGPPGTAPAHRAKNGFTNMLWDKRMATFNYSVPNSVSAISMLKGQNGIKVK